MRLKKYQHVTVTWGDWCVSTRTGDGIDGAILSVFRHHIHGKALAPCQWAYGYGDGRLFPDTESATQWAFDHGYLQLYFIASDLRARRKANGWMHEYKAAVRRREMETV
jgi:hypothetical protein